jgi:DNA-binding beta-propeller fold protein YncE
MMPHGARRRNLRKGKSNIMRKTITLLASIGVLTLAAILFSGSFSSAAGQAAGPSGYRVIKAVPVGGEGFWDYLTVDSEARRLYISHATHVTVMDTDTYAIVGEISDTEGVHGIALAPEFGRGFTSNGGTNTVTIFDLKTLKTIGRTKTGKRPDAIVYDPASRRVFAFNGDAASATVIEAATGNVAGTIQLGGDPEFAAADGEGHIYDNLEDLSMVLQIDSRRLKVTNRWPLAPCKSPSSMAIDKQHRRLFVGCANRIMAIMDADNGRVVATAAIGEGVDANRFDPQTNYAFASNGDGTLTVVHEDSPDKFSVVENVTTRKGARTLALDERTHKIFLATAELGPMVKGAHWPPAKPGTFVILVVARESPLARNADPARK